MANAAGSSRDRLIFIHMATVRATWLSDWYNDDAHDAHGGVEGRDWEGGELSLRNKTWENWNCDQLSRTESRLCQPRYLGMQKVRFANHYCISNVVVSTGVTEIAFGVAKRTPNPAVDARALASSAQLGVRFATQVIFRHSHLLLSSSGH